MLSHLKRKKIIHLKNGEDNIREIVHKTLDQEDWKKLLISNRKKNPTNYYNVPCAFDIETSSFYQDGEKKACMYIWQFGICGYCFTGRTWWDFMEFIEAVREVFDLSLDQRLVVYVHNLSYEFQFIRKWFTWKQVFAIDMRKPAYGVTDFGLEFRCSYILTGKSLEKCGDDLRIIKCKKLHTLDYSLPRHSGTELTTKEMNYCINDIMVVMCMIYEKMLQDGNICRILVTKTGYVRKLLRDKCLYSGQKSHKKIKTRQFTNYRRLMGVLTLDGYREYKLCKEAFMGGFTHSNPRRTNKLIKASEDEEAPGSEDFTSAYPYDMIASDQFPMSKGEFVRPRNKEEFEHNLKYYACIFEVELHDLKATFFNDFYIPFSKCRAISGAVTSNGRLVSAHELTITVTELDWDIICRTYTFNHKKTRIGYFVRYRRGYLPTPIVECVLSLYKDKTELKDVEGMEEYYQLRKELLNSCFGCIVTDILRPENTYSEDWDEPKTFETEAQYRQWANNEIEKYNNKKNRFLFYPWGVYITALNRHNLWMGILEFNDDYIYSDTDSIKAVNISKHQRYIDNYNRHCKVLLEEAMEHHGLDLAACHPLTVKGEEKWLGVWDFEGYYEAFKTLGAKRYSFKKYNKKKKKMEYSITVSGLNKRVTVPYLLKTYGKKGFFDCFTDDLFVPAEHTGKLCHTYIDEECSGKLVDLDGIEGEFYEKTYIHLEPEEYSLSITPTFLDLLTRMQSREEPDFI